MTDELNIQPEMPEMPAMPEMGELWDDEADGAEDFGDFAVDMGPTARVLLPGRAPLDVPLPAEGQTFTVAQVLDQAGVAIRAGNQTVYVDGVVAAMDTMIGAGQTIMPVGAVKGGK